MTVSKRRAKPSFRQAGTSASGRPKSRTPRPKSPASRPRPIIIPARTAPTRPPIPDAAFSQPTAAGPADEQGDLAVAQDRAGAREQLTADALTRPLRRSPIATGPDPQDQRRRCNDEYGGGQKDRSRVRRREEKTAESRTDKDPDALDRSSDDVGGAQLIRGVCENRCVRGLRRSERGSRNTDEAREDVHQPGRRVGKHRHCRRDDEPGPEQVRSHHDQAPVVSVAQGRSEGGRQRRRSPAKQPHDSNRPCPALLVGVDHHRHAVRPGSDDRASPGELETTQSPVVEHAAEGRPCLRKSFQEAPHSASIPRLRPAARGGKIVTASPVWWTTALTRSFRKEAVMTDEQRLEETTENLDELNDDVEAHRRHIADEEKSTDKSDDGDDVEAHKRR